MSDNSTRFHSHREIKLSNRVLPKLTFKDLFLPPKERLGGNGTFFPVPSLPSCADKLFGGTLTKY
jgi:hypothetical protein